MEEAREAILKRCLSTPTKPPARKFAAFASQRNSSNNTEEHTQKNISSHNSVTAESNVWTSRTLCKPSAKQILLHCKN